MRPKFQVDIFHMCSQSSFSKAEKVALIALKLDGFGVNFIDMNFQLGSGDGFEGASVTEMLASVFMHSFDMKLESLLPGKASST